MVLDLDDGSDRAEALLMEDTHVRRHALENGRPIKLLFVPGTAQDSRAFGHRVLDVPVNNAALRAADQRADNCVRLARIADLQRLSQRKQSARRTHQRSAPPPARARICHADLSLMEENAESSGAHRVVDVRISEHDRGLFPPISRVNFFSDLAASTARCRPVWVEPVKVTMRTRGSAKMVAPISAAGPGITLSKPLGSPRRVEDLGDLQTGDRRQLRRLEHEAVAGGERKHDLFHSQQKRCVERRNAGDHAEQAGGW